MSSDTTIKYILLANGIKLKNLKSYKILYEYWTIIDNYNCRSEAGHVDNPSSIMFPTMMVILALNLMLLCSCFAYFSPSSTFRKKPLFKISTNYNSLRNFHTSLDEDYKKSLMFFINKIITIPTLALLLTAFIYPEKSIAVGELSEFKQQNIVLQDVSLNVPKNVADGELFKALFVNKFQILRSSPSFEEIVLGFGPDTYTQPKSFVPGISSFQEYGGHATITLLSKSLPDDNVEAFERGNGLQYIKIGAEDIRLSKAIEKGKYKNEILFPPSSCALY